MAVGQYVGLGNQRQHLALRIVPLARELESPANAPLAPFARIDGRLGGDLIGRVLLEETADARVEVFRVLAHHHEVNVRRALAGEWCFYARIQLDRTKIDVLI